MKRRDLLLFGVLVLMGSEKVDPTKDRERKYEVVVTPLAGPVGVGASLAAKLAIQCKEDAYVHPDAPFKIVATSENETLKVTKEVLTRGDAEGAKLGEKATVLKFAIPVSAAAKGDGVVKASLSFFLCTPAWCHNMKKDMTWSVVIDH